MCMGCGLSEAMGRFSLRRRKDAASPFRLTRRSFVAGTFACTAAVSTAPFGALAQATSGAADIILRGGKVYTQNPAQPWAEAVAVRGKAIAAVGTNAEVDALRGPETKVVELNGRLVLPGFVEGHVHPFLGAFLTAGVDLQVETREEALEAIARYAKEHPEGSIRGFGWRVDMFPESGPTKEELDKIVPDRPAIFFSIDAHSLWANSKALAAAEVTKDTPDPVPGFSTYARDKDGNPTGLATELDAVLTVVNGVEPISAEGISRLLEEWLPKAAAAGITCVFDAGVPPIGEDQGEILSLYTALERRGVLPFRVFGAYTIKSPPLDETVKTLKDIHGRVATELVKVNTLKVMGDGTQEGYTAWLLEPYSDKPDSIGSSPFDAEEWNELIGTVDAAGFDIHVHACGERTARTALDAIEAAVAANPPRDRRHTIAHLIYVDDADIPRFGKLGVTSQFSANWMTDDPDNIDVLDERYGPVRSVRLMRVRSTLESGGRVSFGTDWPAAGYLVTYKPLDSIQIGVTRQHINRTDRPVLEPVSECLTLAQAVHANTLGAAYQLRMEDKIGSLEVGKLADLIVLEKNIFEGSVRDIARTKIDLTLMNGKVTHGAV